MARDRARWVLPQHFNIWVYGETEKLFRGSGLFVGETGVEANHHFLLEPSKNAGFRFSVGTHRVEVYAQLLGDRARKLLFSQSLDVDGALEKVLNSSDDGVYFDWYPELGKYVPHVHQRSQQPRPGAGNWLGTPAVLDL